MSDTDSPERPDRSESPTVDGRSEEPGTAARAIGAYRLVRRLGEGGMGEVWLAEQREPIRRAVALKLIRWGMETASAVARFEAERQALAVMDHPNIARVFDAGVTDDGRPYFAMEYVAGIPITEYCDRHELSTRARLELFATVCSAVQHAHRKGILHRDLKPSNVLVARHDDAPLPKVIDFGIAKAVGRPLTDRTLMTEYGALVGTPEYMSPEQAGSNPLDVDTRSDVYSLGVLLYELLTGTLPFDRRTLLDAGFDEMRRILRETDPPRPSERLRTLEVDASVRAARRQSTEPGVLARSLRGDLDWIVMRALEKEPSRRYGSASELADDVRRHLDDQPVSAGPPSIGYRARKFVRRHRTFVGVGATIGVLLVVFLGVLTWQGARVVRERDRADQEAKTARKALAFVAEVFGAADPGEARGETLTAREILERGARRVRSDLGDEPEVRAALLRTIGEVQSNLGLLEDAEPTLVAALELHRELYGDEHPETFGAKQDLGVLLVQRGKLEEAEPLLRDALAGNERHFGADARETLSTVEAVGALLRSQGDLEGAERCYRRTLEGYLALVGRDHEDTLTAQNNVGFIVGERGRTDEALAIHLEVVEGFRRTLGDDHPTTLTVIGNVGVLYERTGRVEEAEPLILEALEGSRRVLGDDHSDTLRALNNLAHLRRVQGRLDESEAAYREALDGRRRTLGDNHPYTFQAMNNLGFILYRQGRKEEGGRYIREALSRREAVLGGDHPDTIRSLQTVAGLARAEGRPEEVPVLLRKAHEACGRVYGERDRITLGVADDLGDALIEAGRPADAEAVLGPAVEAARAEVAADDPLLGGLLHSLGRGLRSLGRLDEAESVLVEAHEILSSAEPDGGRTRAVAADLAALYEAHGDEAGAARWRPPNQERP